MLAPFTMSQTKCAAVAALPPFPATNRARLASRASLIHSIACATRPVSMVESVDSSFSRYSVGKDITRLIVSRAAGRATLTFPVQSVKRTMALAAGDRLGPYEILAPIGAGGMGEVYKARDTRLDRIVAIKVSKTRSSANASSVKPAPSPQLNHPHICQLYDVGPNYLVMEYIEGTPLKGPLPLERAVEYAGQILDALDAAHKKAITHRDLKPANILITKQGIKLLDFGLAKQTGPVKEADATVTQGLTGQGQIFGHAAIHVAGAVAEQGSGRAQRFVQLRLRAVRDADRQASV